MKNAIAGSHDPLPTTADSEMYEWAQEVLMGEVLDGIQKSLEKLSVDRNLTEEEVLVAAASFSKEGGSMISSLVSVIALIIASLSLLLGIVNEPGSEWLMLLATILLLVLVPGSVYMAFKFMQNAGIPNAVEAIFALRLERSTLHRAR